MENDAGPEQVNRRVTKNIDDLIHVVESTVRSVQTALYIKNVAERYGVQKAFNLRVIKMFLNLYSLWRIRSKQDVCWMYVLRC